jgi:hypothetical protein
MQSSRLALSNTWVIIGIAAASVFYSSLTHAAETLEDAGLPDMQWLPQWRVQMCGESVLVPVPVGYQWLDVNDNESCPFPRFSAPKAFAAGWAAKKTADTDPFNPCWDSVKDASYFILPKTRKNKPSIGLVSESTFKEWIKSMSTPKNSEPLAQLILASSVNLVGACPRSSMVLDYAGGDNEGFPFVAGVLKLENSSEKSTKFYFAAAISMIGETWAVSVSLSKVRPDLRTDVADKAIGLAKAVYYLNKDFRGPPRRTDDKWGPMAWQGGRRD